MSTTRVAVLAADDHARADGGAHRGQVLGGVGLAERAADRAAVAHDGVGDHALGVGEDGEPGGQQLGLEQVPVARHRADPHLAAALLDVAELVRQRIDVDHVAGRREAELHHRQQAVTAGEQARVGTELPEQQQRMLDGRRAFVAERCRDLQDRLLVSPRHTPCRCYGRAVNYRPKGSLRPPFRMTLAQLQSFVLVARHGSVKAAAAELEVTEPAVSVAVAALRKELGDELFVRSGRGIALTPGGRRLAALAGEILGARRAGAPLGGGVAGRAAPHAGRGHQPRRRAHQPADRDVRRRPGRAGDRGRVGAGRRVRRPARAPAGGHRARPAPGSRAGGDDRLGAVPALPADHRRRARAPARRAAGARPRRPRGGALADRAARHRSQHDDRAVLRAQRARPRATSARTAATPPPSRPPPPARGSC